MLPAAQLRDLLSVTSCQTLIVRRWRQTCGRVPDFIGYVLLFIKYSIRKKIGSRVVSLSDRKTNKRRWKCGRPTPAESGAGNYITIKYNLINENDESGNVLPAREVLKWYSAATDLSYLSSACARKSLTLYVQRSQFYTDVKTNSSCPATGWRGHGAMTQVFYRSPRWTKSISGRGPYATRKVLTPEPNNKSVC